MWFNLCECQLIAALIPRNVTHDKTFIISAQTNTHTDTFPIAYHQHSIKWIVPIRRLFSCVSRFFSQLLLLLLLRAVWFRLITITDAFHKLIIKNLIPFAWCSGAVWKCEKSAVGILDKYCLKRSEESASFEIMIENENGKKCSEAEVSQLLLAFNGVTVTVHIRTDTGTHTHTQTSVTIKQLTDNNHQAIY